MSFDVDQEQILPGRSGAAFQSRQIDALGSEGLETARQSAGLVRRRQDNRRLRERRPRRMYGVEPRIVRTREQDETREVVRIVFEIPRQYHQSVPLGRLRRA